jgi:hypothetical protein
MMATAKTRIERDLLGELSLPADAYWGVQTARALENFKISGVELRLYPNFIKALAMVKLGAARANYDSGEFSDEILAGRSLSGDHRRQPARPFQAGRVPGRRGHLDQHERQRGDREPRARADGAQEG